MRYQHSDDNACHCAYVRRNVENLPALTAVFVRLAHPSGAWESVSDLSTLTVTNANGQAATAALAYAQAGSVDTTSVTGTNYTGGAIN